MGNTGHNGEQQQQQKVDNMCLYPRLIDNRKYRVNKKNGGKVPQVKDKRTLIVPVGCGKCMECKKQRATQWNVRLQEDVKKHKNGIFVTLTFSDESIKELDKDILGLEGYDLDNEIATLAVKRFRERWRKKYGKSVRHWLVTELGHNGTENIHMHGIIWTDNAQDIENIWTYGYIWKGTYVSERTMGYISKYINKVDKKHKEYNPKVLTSPGIGANYTEGINIKKNKYNGTETIETYKTRSGQKLTLPIYWRNKIYTEEEKEQLWLQKLDKEERWVGGEKIDISNGEEEYYKALEYYRAKNKRMGYGNNEINWDKKRYENEKRKTKHKERIKRATKNSS